MRLGKARLFQREELGQSRKQRQESKLHIPTSTIWLSEGYERDNFSFFLVAVNLGKH